MKLIQLNVERDRHVDRWIPFLQEEMPDVVCLQEVMEPTLARVAKGLGLQVTYQPMARLHGYEEGTDGTAWGIALLTKEPHRLESVHHYRTNGQFDELPTFDKEEWKGRYQDAPSHRILLVAQTAGVRIGVTHFTWTPNGHPNEVQRNDLQAFCKVLDGYEDLALCGDFNIPRATNELYHILNHRLIDNIPPEVESTLDETLHRKPELRHVVDYVFTTPHYTAHNVRVVGGLSDHKAIVADIERV